MFSGRSKIVNAREGQNAATLSGADIQAPMLQPKLANTASGSEKISHGMPWAMWSQSIKIFLKAKALRLSPGIQSASVHLKPDAQP